VPEPPPALALAAVAVEEPAEPLNEHQKALIAFTEVLERQIQEPAPVKALRAVAMQAASALTRVETAKSRVESFLAQQKP
jgi:hypothetical protein